MAKTKNDPHLYERAALGAQAGLNDLLCDAKLLVGLLPPFRNSVDKDGLPVSFLLKQGRDRADAKAKKEALPRPVKKASRPVKRASRPTKKA